METEDSGRSGDTTRRKSGSWKENLFFSQTDKSIHVFDTYMLLVIAYSCFTSAYYVAFDAPKDGSVLWWLENLVFASYSIDIIINFMRVPMPEEMTGYPPGTNP